MQEVDGAVWKQGVAAFRLLPYVSRGDPALRRITHEEEDSDDSDDYGSVSEPDN